MAKLGGTFDASGVEPNAPLEALPPGDYKVQILQSEMRVTKAGTGQILWLDMEVLEGPLKGRARGRARPGSAARPQARDLRRARR